jgi:protein gp37
VSDKSAIQWCDATWNPTVGCSIVSPGCTNCYAMKTAHDLGRRFGSQKYGGLTKVVNGNPVWTGEVRLHQGAVYQPLTWKKPRRVFVNSMSDLFHEALTDDQIDRVFAVMALCPQHTFQVLTKRAERMRAFCSDAATPYRIARACLDLSIADKSKWTCEPWPVQSLGDDVDNPDDVTMRSWPLSNLWLGVSAERQEEADERIPHLLQTPAAVRFVSAEPLLGPLTLHPLADGTNALSSSTGPNLDWLIVGGESGPSARPMHPDWARSIRDQCAAAGVAYFFKQWGEWAPHQPQAGGDLGGDVRAGRVRIVHPTGQSDVEVSVATGGHSTILGSRYMIRVGKKAAGRLLDGKEHNEFPAIAREAHAA